MDQELSNKIDSIIRSGNVEQARAILTEHPEAINPVPPALTWIEVALNSTAAAGGTQMLSLLVSLGCDVNAGTANYLPLSKMAYAGNVKLTRFLLEQGADPNAGKPVIWAIQSQGRNSLELVKLLEQHGADLHRCFSTEIAGKQIVNNALSTATSHKKHDVVEYLRSLGAELPASPTTPSEPKVPTIRARSNRQSGGLWNNITNFLTRGKSETARRFSSLPDPGLTDPFDKIYRLLIEAIPNAIGAFEYPEPLCLVRVYYYDTHAPCTYLDFRCVTVSQRRKTLEQHQDKPGGPLFFLWGSGEECGTQLDISIPAVPGASSKAQARREMNSTHPDSQIKGLFATVYELLDVDSNRYMQEFRQTLQLVTLKLNELDWGQVCEVSDDFVIAPADGSHFFGRDEDDLIRGIPAERISLLQSRGFLGSSERMLGR